MHFWDLYVEGFEGKRALKLRNTFAEADISQQLNNWVSQGEIQLAFEAHIETLILNDNPSLDEERSDQLNMLYDMLNFQTVNH